ncbi:palmitoyltransferase ZDHHC6-like [Thrips palmi]|uniref:Palmitoyltransferase n=1 Tax=Thrips palmi TaxID=161013 RepID=A0A6P8ZUS8_THRPL|nr:palmitoyltransferase ZDHHC6-like [Thrips palmi]
MIRQLLKRIFHWGPLAALSIIKCITFMTMHCCSMWWPASQSWGGTINSGVFLCCSLLTIYNFLSAMMEGPGFLPFKWRPKAEEDEQHLQYCEACQGYKAPRAHHCRKCGRCVAKMDHHCPWINTCVGHVNHGHFTAFLFWAVLGCFQSTVILSCSLYRGINRVWYMYYGTGNEPRVYLSANSLFFCIFALGLSVGVVLAVGMLLYFQIRSILRNQTGVEDWIVEKAHYRRVEGQEKFVFPYDLGWKENWSQVMNWSCEPVGDGIYWPVREGCDQFTLTREQQEQKREKRERTRLYSVINKFSGWHLPFVNGWGALCHVPYTDEPRIKLDIGENVFVTRWRKYWLFGEKEGAEKKSRGWFPRSCVVEVSCNEDWKSK